MLYLLLGVLSPVILNLIHLIIGVWITMHRGNVMGVGFSATGFLTKSIGMVFLTWLGVGYFELNFRIYIPLLTFFWFLTHVAEGIIIQKYMTENSSNP